MACFPFEYCGGQYSAFNHEAPGCLAGMSCHTLGDDEPQQPPKGAFTPAPKGVTFTPYREVILRWEWISRFNKSILEVATTNTHAQDEEPRTVISDMYKDYLLLLTVLGTKEVFGVKVVNDRDGPDKCYVMVKGKNVAKLKEVECYLGLVQQHCGKPKGCPLCNTTKSIDTRNMAYRDGNYVYAMCYKGERLLQPLKGVIVQAHC